MSKHQLPQNKQEALMAIKGVIFKPFDAADWSAFAGVECEHPLIAYVGDYVAIIEDGMVFFLTADDSGECEQSREWDLFAELGCTIKVQ